MFKSLYFPESAITIHLRHHKDDWLSTLGVDVLRLVENPGKRRTLVAQRLNQFLGS